MKTARLIALVTALLLLLSGCAAGPETEKTQRQLYAMDTVMLLTAYGRTADAALDAAEARICELEADLDPERDGSSVREVNEHAGEWVRVSADCLSIAETANEIAAQSGGALAPQLYGLVGLWGFTSGEYRVPEQSEIDAQLAAIDGFRLETDAANSALRIPAGTTIAFGAVAKGCASKYAIDAMRKSGVTSGIVSLGGNVQTLGTKPDGSNWIVAVEDPNDTSSYVGMLSVGETAIITSGSYQRYFIGSDGMKYHHIIDPSTGRPADNDLVSVTIVCEDGTLADALSTAMFVLGENAALKYWRENGGFEMIMINKDNEIMCTTGLIEVFTLTNRTDYTLKMVE